MKLNFLKAVWPVAKAGETKEITDKHAAELYVAHGYAVPAAAEAPAGTGTLGARPRKEKKQD